MTNTITRLWLLYVNGRDYNNRLVPNQYATVETNREFFSGNQWLNLPDTPAMRSIPKPVFNILRRIATLFIASLTSSNVTIRTERLSNTPDGGADDPSRFANAVLENLLEKLDFSYWLRDALYRGAITGDYAAHFWFDPSARPFGQRQRTAEWPIGEIRMELVDGINVMFGNPNDRVVENQPYVLIIGRDMVRSLQEEARQHRKHGGDPDSIRADSETQDFPGVGGRTELSESDANDPNGSGGKALYVLCYERKRNPDGTETIHASKATKEGVIFDDVDTGLTFYPIAWGNWERRDYQYHGEALITRFIPNQILINTTFATAMRHLQLTAFPKTIYNADLISAWSSEVGSAIGIQGLQAGQSISSAAMNLNPPEMSGQISAFLDKLFTYTKECAGATDAQMGSIRPDNTSALLVLLQNADVPLENVRAELYRWVEQIGRILLDLVGTYYGIRVIQVEEEVMDLPIAPDGMAQLDLQTGLLPNGTSTIRVPVEYDFSRFKDLVFDLRVDVGATAYFSETAMSQTLDNLLERQIITDTEYLERIPDRYIPRKQELLDARRGGGYAAGGQVAGGGRGGPVAGGALSAERAEQGLPTNLSASLNQVQSQLRNKALSLGARKVG